MSKAETCSCWYVLLDTWYNNIVVFDAYYILRLSEEGINRQPQMYILSLVKLSFEISTGL
jgi:hypothetical protein